MTFRLISVLLAALACQSFAADRASAERSYQRGLVQEKARRYSAAVIFYESATVADPDFAPAWRQMGTCDYYLGNKAKALESYELYLRLNPSDAALRNFAERLRPPTATPTPAPTPVPAQAERGDGPAFSLGFGVGPLSVRMPIPFKGPKPEKATLAWVDLKDARQRSDATGKPILYDFTAAWCGPCKMLAKDVFEDPESAAWINRKFIPVSVVDRQREDGRNGVLVQKLQVHYRIEGYPTLIIEGAGQKELMRLLGYAGKEETMRQLREASSR